MNLIIWLRGKENFHRREIPKDKGNATDKQNIPNHPFTLGYRKWIVVTALCNLRLNHDKNYTYLYHNIRFLKFKVYFHRVAYSLK